MGISQDSEEKKSYNTAAYAVSFGKRLVNNSDFKKLYLRFPALQWFSTKQNRGNPQSQVLLKENK